MSTRDYFHCSQQPCLVLCSYTCCAVYLVLPCTPSVASSFLVFLFLWLTLTSSSALLSSVTNSRNLSLILQDSQRTLECALYGSHPILCNCAFTGPGALPHEGNSSEGSLGPTCFLKIPSSLQFHPINMCLIN